MKFKIVDENEFQICIDCIDEDGKTCRVTRRKNSPAKDALDFEADSIIKEARLSDIK